MFVVLTREKKESIIKVQSNNGGIKNDIRRKDDVCTV